MSFRQDYIERAIRKLAEMVARALGLARSGEAEAGLTLLEDAIASTFGMPLPMLLKLTPETVWSLFGPERARMLAEALTTHHAILELQGRGAHGEASKELALALTRRADAQSTMR
ncbi:MAG TPA: hypothetical protein VMI54_18830 [Polyangiaceae bacterium]|nr:hypothetical protein [Polyangiaceae bacterium]